MFPMTNIRNHNEKKGKSDLLREKKSLDTIYHVVCLQYHKKKQEKRVAIIYKKREREIQSQTTC